MTEPLLLIIKYLLKKKNVINEDHSIDSFFSNGISFPIFIAKILNFITVPNINWKPKSKYDCENNNNKAFQFFLECNENIGSQNPKFKTREERIQFLKLILTNYCFPDDYHAVIKKINILFKPLNMQITKENDLFSFKNMSLFLYILTNRSFPITNCFQDIFKNCSKANIPIVIDEKSIESDYSYIFLIQIQILFDFFSGCNQQMLDSIEIQLNSEEFNEEQFKLEEPNEEQSNIEESNEEQFKLEEHNEEQSNTEESNEKQINQEESNEKQISQEESNEEQIRQEKSNEKQFKPEKSNEERFQLEEPNEKQSNTEESNEKQLNQEEVNEKQLKPEESNEEQSNTKESNEKQLKPEEFNEEQFKLEEPSEEQSNTEESSEKRINQEESNEKQINQEEINEKQLKPEESNEERSNTEESRTKQLKPEKSNEKQSNTEESNEKQLKPEQSNEKQINQEESDGEQFKLEEPNDEQSSTEESNEKQFKPEESNEKQFKPEESDEEQFKLEEPNEEQSNTEESNEKQINQEETNEKQLKPEESDEKELTPGEINEEQLNQEESIEEESIHDEYSVYEYKLQENKEKAKNRQASELWNNSLNTYSCIDGILVFKSARVSQRIYEAFTEGEKVNQNNLYQIFKYDEERLCWSFCKNEFDKLFGRSNEDPQIPLVLIIDSDLRDVSDWLSNFKEVIFKRNLGEDISVFAFQQELPEETKEKKFFLFVYIPTGKAGDKNIRSIFYQIYTFLYLICDVSLVIHSVFFDSSLDGDLKLQINFLKNIIKISDMYLKNTKNQDGKNMLIDHSQLLLFIESDEENIPIFNKFVNDNIKKKNKICTNVFRKDHLTIMNSITIKNSYRFSELRNICLYFNNKFSELSELYLFITIDLKSEDHPYFIKSIINTRFEELYSDEKYKNMKGLIIDDIKKESEQFYPQCDKYFSSIFEKWLIEKSYEKDQFEKTTLINELQKYSQNNLDNFDKKIKESGYCNEKQIDTFLKNHKTLLQKHFFKIIQSLYKGSINLVYERFLDVLQSQISKDNEKIYVIIEKNQTKNKEANTEKFEEINKRRTNYVIKETEKERETEINIDSDDELDRLIPQDF